VAEIAGPEWIFINSGVTADEAPENTPESFVVNCAVQGLGRLAAEGEQRALQRLREAASDPRWRIRESVAMALQTIGDASMPRLLEMAEELARGSLLEQRAAAAAICEPRLLKDSAYAGSIIGILDRITASLAAVADRRSDAFRALRQGMAYCWSVSIAAYPDIGRPAFERWLATDDSDVRWMLRENLKKNRLQKLDPAWVARCLDRLKA
jgi:hypothetical protein